MRPISHKSIRSLGCKCVADRVCDKCESASPYGGHRYSCTWNEAVRIHNEEVRKHAVSSRRKTGKR
jgi:hypothetical protein